MKKRPCTIHELELLSWEPPYAIIQTSVSAGTYIRSLARDIALSINSRAHLCALNRTKVGNFPLEAAAVTISPDALRPLDRELFNTLSLPVFIINEKAVEGFFNGKALETLLDKEDLTTEALYAGVFNAKNSLLGILERRSGKWFYSNVFRK